MESVETQDSPELSVIIPSMNEALNLRLLLPALKETLDAIGPRYEVLVVDKDSPDGTEQVVVEAGARYICETTPGYGAALLRGVREARGEYLITMDADLSHPAQFIRDLWAARDRADVLIASRYVPGGNADQPLGRYLLSRVLNAFFRIGLSLNARDLSSGFRLYHRRVFRDIRPLHTNFVILVEILIEALRRGRRFAEVPFHYQPRGQGRSHAQVVQFGKDYLRLFFRMWRARNSIDFPDYDWRAHDSRIPLQRYWQRRRHALVLGFVPPGAATLDVGCGSSRIMADLPHAVGVDLRHERLCFMKATNRLLARADGLALPIGDAAFDCVICSQVIEQVPDENGRLLDELTRVLRPGGTLVIGTPDYGNWQWRLTERLYRIAAPGAYADEHVTHYTFDSLTAALRARGHEILDHAYILKGELIIKARKRT
ncbi:MAG TPA: glycosyltransferase [Candidatus Hydrogenedentes bacterium]|nr:glycosyltransferase [Candidatus Hydrogenedentota bacterium]